MEKTAHPSGASSESEAPLPLFRTEVWDAKATQWFGPIRLSQPVPSWAMAVVAITVIVGLTMFGLFGTYTKKLHVTGITMPAGGSITISTPTSGIIARSYVSEGQRVRRNQTLFEISSEQHVSNGALAALLSRQLEARQESLETERRSRITQEAERRRELDERLVNLAAEENQAQQDIELNSRRLQLAQNTVAKYEKLRANGFVSEAQVQQKMEDAIDVNSRLSNLNRAKLAIRANRITLRSERDGLANNLAATIAQLDRAEASLQQEKAENQTRHQTLVQSTGDGIVTTITNRSGQFVPSGQVLATLIPGGAGTSGSSEPMEVHLYVTNSAIGFARVGQSLRIRYRAFPYERFGLYDGKVIAISKTPLGSNELPANIAGTVFSQAFPNSSGANESLYRIRVRPNEQSINVYGQPQPLTVGMTLEADLLLETRRVWEWVLAPALAFAAR